MYIDVVPNRKSPPSILLRESYRESGKVKKRTLANLSKLPQELIEHIRQALSGQSVVLSETLSGAIYGTLFVLNELAGQCGVQRALGESRLAKLTLFLVLARIAHQGSRLSALRWARDHAVKAVLGLEAFNEEDLYAALDWVASQQEHIEARLYQDDVQRTGRTPALILYDVTSSYLEGEHNELGAYGYNRDGKKGKKQIVIGLLTAKDGEPLSIEVFEGHTADPKTFGVQVEKLTQRFALKEVVWVGDRGMIKTRGKATLNSLQFRYITALTDPQIRKFIRQDVLQPDLFDEHVVEVHHQGKRLILRCDPATQRKERHRREEKLQRLTRLVEERNAFVAQSKRAQPEAGLKRLQIWARRHKMAGFIQLTLKDSQIKLQINAQAKQDEALLDGCYCLESDVETAHLSTEEIHDRYKDLQHVEQNVRRLKTAFLEVRPRFVRKESRTRGHVFIAMLALTILRLMERKLRAVFATIDNQDPAETLDSALAALSRLCLQHYPLGNQDITFLPRPDSRQQNILSALDVKLVTP